MNALLEMIRNGGPERYPILMIALCLALTLGIVIERAIYLFGSSTNKDSFLSAMQKCVLAGDVTKALKVCSSTNVPLARIVQAGLTKIHRPDEEVQSSMDEAALRELPKLNARTSYLALLANLAMLSGLLGTVLGLIHSFGSVADADPSKKQALLAGGISIALNSTAFGLFVAISGLIGYAILNGKTQKLEDDINEASVKIVNLVVGNRDKVTLPTN